MAFGRSLIGAHRGSKLRSRRGSEAVEGMMMLLPFFALVFILIDASWGLFVKATLQYAVQAGVTYASTDSDTATNVAAAVQATVNKQSLGLIPATGVAVTFLTPAMAAPAAGTLLNQTGNVVQATVNYQFAPLAPLFRSGATIPLSATAASVLTAPAVP
jgi:Flp pilus assembly protein TadG